MNLTTSLWTSPMNYNRWDLDKQYQYKNTMLMCALCITYAKLHGAHITMHTDSYGAETLSKFGYDKIFVDLDVLNDSIKTNPTILWAAGKSIALESEPLGTIHIDNDVFILKDNCLEEMNFDNYDFIFQHIEHGEYKEKQIFKDILKDINLSHEFACCVGIIGFNSKSAKRQYLDNYNYWFNNLQYSKTSNFTNIDLVLEQTYLYNMMEDMGYRGKSLLGDLRSEQFWQLSNKALNIGYEHVIGPTKFDEYILSKLNKRLKRLNPELYEIIQSL